MMIKLSKKDIYDFLAMFFIVLGNYLLYSTLAETFRMVVCVLFVILGSVMTFISVVKKIKNKEYTKKQYLIVGAIALTAVLVWHRPAEIYVSTLLAMNYITQDLRKMIKNIFFACAISYAVVVLMWIIGITIGVIAYRGDFSRHGVGFNHPNVAVRFFVPIILSGAILCKNNRLFLFLSLFAAGLGFFVTNSRGGCLVIMIFCVLSMLPKVVKKSLSNIKMVPGLFVFFTIISFFIMSYFDESLVLNKILSGRPSIWRVYMNNLSFFGQIYQVHEMPIDNVFLHMLYYGGLYGFLFYLVLYFVAFKKTDCKRNCNIFILFLSVFIYGLVENYSNQGESFYLLILMIQLLDYKKIKELDDDYTLELVEEKSIEFIEETV